MPAVSGFSLWRNGPVYRLLRSVGVARGRSDDAVRIAALAVVVGLAPLFVFIGVSGVWDPEVVGPLALVRWLAAVPLVIVSSELIDVRIGWALDHLRAAGVVPPERHDALAEVERRIASLTGSPWTLAAIVAVVLAVSAGTRLGEPFPDRPLEIWHLLVNLPLQRIILVSWLVRWLCWAHMVWLVTRLDLVLTATHPDGRVGLAELGRPLVGLTYASFGLGCLVATAIATDLTFTATDMARFGGLVVLWVALVLVVAAVPGMMLTPTLVWAKRRALWEHGSLAQRHDVAFERRWLDEGAEPPLGSPDVSSLADLHAAYESVVATQILPLDKQEVLVVVIPALVPVIAVMGTVLPAEELVKILLGFLG